MMCTITIDLLYLSAMLADHDKFLIGSCIGLLAYKRPKLCAKIAATGLLIIAPAWAFTAVTVKRWSTLAGARTSCNAHILRVMHHLG